MREEVFSQRLDFDVNRIDHARGAAGRVSRRAPSNRGAGRNAYDRRSLRVSSQRVCRRGCCDVR